MQVLCTANFVSWLCIANFCALCVSLQDTIMNTERTQQCKFCVLSVYCKVCVLSVYCKVCVLVVYSKFLCTLCVLIGHDYEHVLDTAVHKIDIFS